MITTGFFFLIVMTAIFVFDIYQTRKIKWLLFLGLALVSVLFICSHYRLFISYFIESGYKSHRIEFYGAPLNHFAALKSSFLMLLRGQPHAYSLQTYIIIPVVLLASILMCKFKKISKPFLYVVIFLIITSLFYGFWQWSAFANIHSVLTAIIPIQLDRFYWLHPMFWFIAFGIALYEISIRFRIGKYITLLAICLQILYGFYYHENFQQRNSPTYKSFYATAQFLDIKKYINLPLDSYRVVSVGLYPSIALFNGFYVLDGYFPDYPLSYKHKFRKVILSELEKNTKAKEYFDWWGSRAYIFSSELMHNNSQNFKGNNLVIKNLDLNYSYLHSIGCRYVISSVKIDTALNNSLFLLKKFDDSNSAWDIYLYKIKV